MNTHADKTTETKNNAAANLMTAINVLEKNIAQDENNRPEVIAQRQIQHAANNSLQVKQLKATKSLANNSSQVKELRSVQKIADAHTTKTTQFIEQGEADRPGDTEESLNISSTLPVQRIQIFWQKKIVRKADSKDHKRMVFETSNLSQEQRAEIVKLLEDPKHKGLLTEIQEEWKALEKQAPPDIDTLLATSAQLTILEQSKDLNKKQTEQIAAIIDQLFLSTRAIANVKEAEQAQLLRDTVQALIIRAQTLWNKSPFQKETKLKGAADDDGLAIDPAIITQGEIAAYRNDIKQMGVWGGLAEATIGANLVNVSANIFNIAANGNYRLITRVGNGANGGGRALLHRGNHYEVVAGAVNGQAFAQGHIVAETERDGNCLFEGLLIVRIGAKLNDNARVRTIGQLRRNIAAGLSEDQIRGSLAQIMTYGEVGGLGSGTRRAISARSHPHAMIQEELVNAQVDVGRYGAALNAYRIAWADNPSSVTTAELYDTLRDMLPEEEVDDESEDLSEGGYIVLTDEKNRIVVRMDSHQNKHQNKKALIPQIGDWKGKKGSTFLIGRGLDWHIKNTAVTMQKWAISIKASMVEGKAVGLKKEPREDGYIYDATAILQKGQVIVDYHCNPKKSEF